jgi:hypothetical protein
MWPAFPASDYYGPSDPLWGLRPTVSLPVFVLAARGVGRPRSGSHVHHVPVDRVGAQLCRCSLASGIPIGLPTGINNRLRSRHADQYCLARTAARPTSTRWSRSPLFSGFNHWFTLVTPFDLARRTRPIWQCCDRPVVVRAASRPSPHLRGQAALSFSGLLRQPREVGLSPASGDMAPRGAPG